MRFRGWLLASCWLLACCSTPPDETMQPDGRSRTDGGRPTDGGLAGVDGGADQSPGVWCRTHPHDLCDDFDDPAHTLATWTISDSLGTSGNGLPPHGGVETTNVVSAPNAFASKTPALAAGVVETVQIQAMARPPEGQTSAQGDLAFEVRVQSGASGRTEVLRVEGVNPIDFRSYGFALVVSPTGAFIELRPGSGAVAKHSLATAPAAGVWTHVAIHLELNVVVAVSTAIRVQVGDGGPESFSLSPGMGVRPFILLGAMVTGPAVPGEIDYDNVTYDAR